jgi:hypothetical protein
MRRVNVVDLMFSGAMLTIYICCTRYTDGEDFSLPCGILWQNEDDEIPSKRQFVRRIILFFLNYCSL